MASSITLWLADAACPPAAAAERAVAAVQALFAEVERQCTRFDPESPLMKLNDRPRVWAAVPDLLYRALAAADRAKRLTEGRFDPRVLDPLVRLGYDRSLPWDDGDVVLQPPPRAADPAGSGPLLARRPRRRAVMLADRRVDLGGIGKGLAIRWAAAQVAAGSRNFLLDAGGDSICRGAGPDGDGWRVGVENPRGGCLPVAVLGLRDRAVCTSSVRRRSWSVGGRRVHHLIDPRTGTPAAGGLRSVTVVGADPAWSEVWSKALFVEGADGIGALAGRRRIAALWVDDRGGIGLSPQMAPYLLWRQPGAPLPEAVEA